jgi:hypothetical protein
VVLRPCVPRSRRPHRLLSGREPPRATR